MNDLKKLTDDQLGEMITGAQTELQDRADKRREDAIEEINRRAKEVGIQVSIKGKKKTAKSLKAGEKYHHPDDPTKVWVAGHGRPPKWFNVARKVA